MRMTTRVGRMWVGVMALVCGLAAETAFGYSGTLAQENYRWRNDDGSEVAATWKAAANTGITGVQRGQNIRLRFSVRETGGSYAASVAGSLQYSTGASGPWTTLGTNDFAAFKMTATSQYASGAATTAQLGSGTFVAGKCVEAPAIEIPSTSIAAANYSNFEFCLQPTAKARGSTKYYFQISGLSTYAQRAELTMAAGEANEPPVIQSALTANASVVASFSYTVQASGSEPITYGASGLPAGLSLVSTNMITGTPAVAGTYNVGLTATNAWGGNAKTLVLTVFANQPPAASNQTATVVESGEALIYLAWGDPDTPLKTDHTFTILSGPSRGSLQSYNTRNNTTAYPDYWYYRAAVGAGTDSFTWKCRDADNDSNVATCTISVTTNRPPTANNSSNTVNTYTRTSVYLSKSDPDSGQTHTHMLVSGPSHGKLEALPASSSWYYTSNVEFTGADSFQWRVSDGVATSGVATVTITVNASLPVAADQTAAVRKDTPTDIPASFTGGGYTNTIFVYQYPSHGSLSVSGLTFRYT
ncbi:MAG: hypothetical protein C0404_09365, partial [Verrucomicrobia bacterium]|nr:hypothetical protein [Verrucomicrobiota bacterium]